MRAQARGRWVDGAIQSMLLPNRAAAAILQQHGATACTDVTGFGLLGHLIEMLQYEDSASLDAEEGDQQQESNSTGDSDRSSNSKRVPEENAVELWLGEVPTLTGATECIKAGIVSSLQPQVRFFLEKSVARS